MFSTDCPDSERLLAYSLGKLPDEVSEEIAAHLDSCSKCEVTISGFDDASDTMIDRLRRPPAESKLVQEPEYQEAAALIKGMVPKAPPDTPASADESSAETMFVGELGEYRLIEKLGEGGMGAVYKALQTKLEKSVALKVLPQSRMEDERAVARFEREMKAVGRLTHPNIVLAHDAREIEGTSVLVMEYVEGLDLAEVVRDVGRVVH